MNIFVMRRNIQRYQRLLSLETDERHRRTLLDLLGEEEAKLTEASSRLPMSHPG